eukprot:SAG22_NODE_7_length_40155_cov_25.241356_38_plen_192_part_00
MFRPNLSASVPSKVSVIAPVAILDEITAPALIACRTLWRTARRTGRRTSAGETGNACEPASPGSQQSSEQDARAQEDEEWRVFTAILVDTSGNSPVTIILKSILSFSWFAKYITLSLPDPIARLPANLKSIWNTLTNIVKSFSTKFLSPLKKTAVFRSVPPSGTNPLSKISCIASSIFFCERGFLLYIESV